MSDLVSGGTGGRGWLVLFSRILFGLAVAQLLAGTALWSAAPTEGTGTSLPLGLLIWLIAIVLVNGIVALLIITRYSSHAVGWILIVVSFSYALFLLSNAFVFSFVHSTPALSTPLVLFFGWVTRWIWLLVAVPIIVFIPLYFPDGRLLSRRLALLII